MSGTLLSFRYQSASKRNINANDKYRRVVWQCNRKYGKKLHCSIPHLTEDEIQHYFVTAFNLLVADKGRYLTEYAEAARKLADTAVADGKLAALQAECDQTLEAIQSCIKENAYTAQNQEEYARRYDELAARYKTAKSRLDELTSEKQVKLVQAEKIRRFGDILLKTGEIAAFDSRLWCAMVESVTVHSKEKIEVSFSGGAKISVGAGYKEASGGWFGGLFGW